MEKFLPVVEKDRLSNEFLHLKQENMTVREYERKFTRLSRFALTLLPTERDRINRFESGLKHGIRGLACAYKSVTYGESFQAALKVEQQNKEKKEDFAPNPKKRNQPGKDATSEKAQKKSSDSKKPKGGGQKKPGGGNNKV